MFPEGRIWHVQAMVLSAKNTSEISTVSSKGCAEEELIGKRCGTAALRLAWYWSQSMYDRSHGLVGGD